MNKLTRWERYLANEINIEFKAALYFYCIIFFDAIYTLLNGDSSISILIMAEIIFTCYIMGYLQVFLFGNFDEAEHLGKRGILGVVICTTLYVGCSYLLSWFDRNFLVTIIFGGFILFSYVCVCWLYRIRRKIESKMLNDMLDNYKKRQKREELK